MRRSLLLLGFGILTSLLGCSGSAKSQSEVTTGGGKPTGDAPDPNFYVFLLIGQSNMEGVPRPLAQDREEDLRIRVLAYDDCFGAGRTYNEWDTASPPLHSCGGGVGPADYFARVLAEAFPDVSIGLVPNAINGVDIDFFRKGIRSARRGEFRIPPDDAREGAYDWVVERARIAQKSGVIRGILFHQGESDSGQAVWLDKVEEIVTDLRMDLGIGDVPFLAGELPYDGLCSGHNSLVNQLPNRITNAHVISAEGLDLMDRYHFDLAAQRELGRRYGEKMLELLNP